MRAHTHTSSEQELHSTFSVHTYLQVYVRFDRCSIWRYLDECPRPRQRRNKCAAAAAKIQFDAFYKIVKRGKNM